MHSTRDFLVRMARPAAKASQQPLLSAMGSFAAPSAARAFAAAEAARIHAASLAQRASAFAAAPKVSPAHVRLAAAPVAAAPAVSASLAPFPARACPAAVAAAPAVEAAEVVGAFECTSPALVPAHVLASQQSSDVAAGVYELCAVPKKRTTIHKRRVRRTGHWQMKLRTLYKPYQTCLGCKQTVAPHFACSNGCNAPRV